MASGMVHIYSAPRYVCPHVEWAVAGKFGVPVSLQWSDQVVEPGTQCTEFAWRGDPTTAASLATVLKQWGLLRFEITRDASENEFGERWSYTPRLGIFHADTGPHGDIVVHEDRLRSLMDQADGGAVEANQSPQRQASAIESQSSNNSDMFTALSTVLGVPWDEELDVFRMATGESGVRWLNTRVG